MSRSRASAEDIVAHFDSLPRAAGSAEDRLRATAKYFRVKPTTVQKHLKFWWPGQKYLKEFGKPVDGRRRPRWDRPTEEIVMALNRHGTVTATAKALKTTSITLTKALKRHGIVQKWTIDERRSG